MTSASSMRRPVVVALSLAIVGGLGIVSVLPGAGLTPVASAAAAAAVVAVAAPAESSERGDTDPQTLELNDAVALSASASSRDAFAAQSVAAQLETMAAAYRTQFIASPGYIGDDYPWAGVTSGQSSLNYTMGQCTDFVAWRLNRDVGSYGEPWALPWSVLTSTGGNAREWKDAWDANGWITSAEPVVGAVAWFGYAANHVAYVSQVNGDGTILIEEYNWDVKSGYGARTVAASSITAFLYPPG